MRVFQKAYFYFYIFILFLPLYSYSSPKGLITELKVLNSDTLYWYQYIYDNIGNKKLETVFRQESSTWTRYSQTEWMYDGATCYQQLNRTWKNNNWETNSIFDDKYVDGNLKTQTQTFYQNGVGTPKQKTEYEYEQGKIVSQWIYDFELNNWKLVQNTRFYYSNSVHPDSVKITPADVNVYSPLTLQVNEYSPEGVLNAQTIKFKVNFDSAWLNTERTVWYYNKSNGKLLVQIRKKWNAEYDKWENSERINYEYSSAGKLLSEVYEFWGQHFWQNDLRYDYEYLDQDEFAKISISRQTYRMWRNFYSINYLPANDVNNLRIESKYDFWGGVQGEYVTSFIPYYFNDELVVRKANSIDLAYLPATAVEKPDEDNPLSLYAYPNPSKGVFYINPDKHHILSWQLINLQGKLLRSKNINQTTGVVDITDFPNGIYVLILNTAERKIFQRLIKN